MRRQGSDHDTVPQSILHDGEVPVTLSIVHEEKNLVLGRTRCVLLDMLECLHKRLTSHPTTLLQNSFGPISRVPHESGIPPDPGNDQYWRESHPHSIYDSNKGHCFPSLTRYLRGNWLTLRTHNLHGLHNSRQCSLIDIVNPVRSKLILLHGQCVSIKECFHSDLVEGTNSSNRNCFRYLQCKVGMTPHKAVAPVPGCSLVRLPPGRDSRAPNSNRIEVYHPPQLSRGEPIVHLCCVDGIVHYVELLLSSENHFRGACHRHKSNPIRVLL